MMDQYDLGLPLCPGPMSLPVFYPEDNSLIKGADAAGDNDWTCPKCGNINFSFQSSCCMKQYNTLKPGSQSAKHEKHTMQKMPGGSWKCEKCNDINYPLKPADSKKSDSPAPDNNDQGAYAKLSFTKASSVANAKKGSGHN